jgi:hypothetical protein
MALILLTKIGADPDYDFSLLCESFCHKNTKHLFYWTAYLVRCIQTLSGLQSFVLGMNMSENRNTREIDPFLLNRSEAAQYLGIGLNTLALLDIPRTKIRSRILYRRDVLEQWTKNRTEMVVGMNVLV